MTFLNVGIIGHVDSGKTNLAKNLSSIASTAAFDKHPQAQQRGITIDLGISKIINEKREEEWCNENIVVGKDYFEIVVIDCPGHASLIKAVIMAANIIDLLILVVDGVKGVQSQTVECMALQEAINKNFLIVITKIDDPLNKFETIERGFRKRFPNVQIFAISNKTGQGIPLLKHYLFSLTPSRQEEQNEEFVAIIDHSFTIKGTTGLILTGTVIRGGCKVGDTLKILNQPVKLKSMQSFKSPLKEAKLGDRVGFNIIPINKIAVSLKESGERCLLYREASLVFTKRIMIRESSISSYRTKSISEISIVDRMHFSIMNETVLSSKVFILHRKYDYYILDGEFTAGSDLLVLFDAPVAILANGPTMIIGSRLDIENRGNRIILYGDAFDHPEPIAAVKKINSRRLNFDHWYHSEASALIGRGLDKFQIPNSSIMKLTLFSRKMEK